VLSSTKSYNLSDRVNASAAVFEEYAGFIKWAIRSKLANESLVEDLFQDFFLTLIANPVPRDIRDTKSYLFRMISHDVIDACRRRKNYQALIKKYAEKAPSCVNNSMPENALLSSEETNKMFKALGKLLPASKAEAVALRYKYGYSTNEIAMKMRIKNGSVNRYIWGGISKLRQLLRAEEVK